MYQDKAARKRRGFRQADPLPAQELLPGLTDGDLHRAAAGIL